jgi:ubiquinone/menaquinone biosynthesis C-methylase UbiE
LLNAGCGNAFIEQSDVNMDIAQKEVSNFIIGDVQNMWMFHDKQFGAVYASHVLEHVENPEETLEELHRVADSVFIITPLPCWPTAWLGPGHKWIFWRKRPICRVPFLIRGVVNLIVNAFRNRVLPLLRGTYYQG